LMLDLYSDRRYAGGRGGQGRCRIAPLGNYDRSAGFVCATGPLAAARSDPCAPISAIRRTAMEPLRFGPSRDIPDQAMRVGLPKKRSFASDFGHAGGPAHVNSSSSAFASIRSAVSKPSVNQP
jgi:hypothetical protein